jgi:ribonuclease HII
LFLPDVPLPQRSIIKGDARCLSIAAASIIAKVTRDRLMVQLDKQYPAYGFARHKGYGTEAHLAALREHGASPVHRQSFAPVRELYGLFENE